MALRFFSSRSSFCAKALKVSGISSVEANTPALRIPAEKVSRFWDYLAAAQPEKSIGFDVALNVPFGAYLVPNLMAAGSGTVGEGLTRACYNYSLIHSSARLRVKKFKKSVRIEFVEEKNEPSSRNYVQYVLTTLICHSRNATGIEWRPTLLRLRGHEFRVSPHVKAFFGNQVLLQCEHDGFEIDQRVWQQKNTRRIPGIIEILESESTRQHQNQEKIFSYAGITEQMIKVCIGTESIKIQDMARKMSLSVRSLQRRLANEGKSFESIVEEARISLANSYLSDRSLTKSEIAYLLGYSEPSAFLRALRRWRVSSR